MRHIHPIQIILLIVFVAAFIYYKRKNAPSRFPGAAGAGAGPRPAVTRPAKVEEPPEAVYARLRKRALDKVPANFVLGGNEDEPYGALMEMVISDSAVTLACFADGDAGLYYQSGGGMVGGGAHETVRKAAKDFLTLAGKAVPRMIKTANHPLPAPGRVRFYVLTPKGILTTETDREALGEESRNELSALFYSGQEVVAQMRQVQSQKS